MDNRTRNAGVKKSILLARYFMFCVQHLSFIMTDVCRKSLFHI